MSLYFERGLLCTLNTVFAELRPMCPAQEKNRAGGLHQSEDWIQVLKTIRWSYQRLSRLNLLRKVPIRTCGVFVS